MSRPTTSPKSSASYFRDLITFWFKSDISKTLTSTFAPSFSQLDFKIFAVRTRSGAFDVEIEKLSSLVACFFSGHLQSLSDVLFKEDGFFVLVEKNAEYSWEIQAFYISVPSGYFRKILWGYSGYGIYIAILVGV